MTLPPALSAEPALTPVPSNDNTERIVHEAWIMFQELGYRGASIDELCRRCGLTKPTLYYYFGNKERLFIHVILRQLQGYRAILESAESFDVRLTRLADTMLSAFTTDLNSMMHDLAHVHDPDLHHAARYAFHHELLGPLVMAMQQAVAAGLLRADQPEFYAWVFLGLVNTFIRSRHDTAPASSSFSTASGQRLVEFFLTGAGR